ncbi:MAG: ribbon-helix-helix protein, CopG family [Sporichthyaceae bacterium]
MTTRTLTFRADAEVDAALTRLQESQQASVSDVIRRAILDAAKAADREETRRWAEEQLADPEQVALTLQVNRDMQARSAYWNDEHPT